MNILFAYPECCSVEMNSRENFTLVVALIERINNTFCLQNLSCEEDKPTKFNMGMQKTWSNVFLQKTELYRHPPKFKMRRLKTAGHVILSLYIQLTDMCFSSRVVMEFSTSKESTK